jgi:hypothetical protein
MQRDITSSATHAKAPKRSGKKGVPLISIENNNALEAGGPGTADSVGSTAAAENQIDCVLADNHGHHPAKKLTKIQMFSKCETMYKKKVLPVMMNVETLGC